MKTRIALTSFIQIAAGLGCFVLFWLATYAAEERAEWTHFWAVAVMCAAVSFGTSYVCARIIAPKIARWLSAILFSAGFIIVSFVSFPSVLEEPIHASVFAFWLTASIALFLCSYVGTYVATRRQTSGDRPNKPNEEAEQVGAGDAEEAV